METRLRWLRVIIIKREEINMIGVNILCLDLIQGACTYSLDSQVQGVRTHPLHP